MAKKIKINSKKNTKCACNKLPSKKQTSPIQVYSECGVLKKVLVHRPGRELEALDPSNVNKYLFSNILNVKKAALEHDAYVKIMRSLGIEVIYVRDLFFETWKQVDQDIKKEFIKNFVKETWLDHHWFHYHKKVIEYLNKINSVKLFDMMVAGIKISDLQPNSDDHDIWLTKPLPNMYFTRDPFACVADGVIINHMKYPIRQPETMFGDFIFKYHKSYRNAIIYLPRKSGKDETIEGGDIFIYNNETLVIGVSERTTKKSIMHLAKNLKMNDQNTFKTIVAIYVPHMPNLMHLDTWLTMVDTNKFIYSPNMLKTLKFWQIDLTKKTIKMTEKHASLEWILQSIIHQKPVLIPVADDYSKHAVDIETHFDATNFLALAPGVVIGYDRNSKTIAALKKAGVKVYTFEGNQLSLGMGSCRCMSMPLERAFLKRK